MNPVWLGLRRIAADLASERVSWALVGGLGAGARTEPRFTRDVDLAVAVSDDAEAERVVRALLVRGYRVSVHLEQEATGRLATVRLLLPHDAGSDAIVDLLFATCGIEPEIVAAAQSLTIVPGLSVPVARTEHLIAMKVLSQSPRRPQDRIDLAKLVAAATPDELRRAREACALVVDRHTARGRDLATEFDALLAEFGRSA